jgi:hypothetical protein
MIVRLAVVCLCLLNGACAVGVQHKYDATDAQIEAKPTGIVAVAVQDARSYILSGNKTPNFVGNSRGGYYNAFDVTTTTGKPLCT